MTDFVFFSHILLLTLCEKQYRGRYFLTNKRNLRYNMLKSVAKCVNYCHFFQNTRYHKIDKTATITTKRYVNELLSPRMCHYSGVPRTGLLVSWQKWNKKLRPVIERHLDSTAIMLFCGYGDTIFYNNLVRCVSIFFIHVPNELYLHWLLADIKFID